MNKTIQKSKELFNSGFGCAEAILMAVAEYNNVDSVLIPRIATGLCGGVAKTNGMCGAVSGGVLAISLIYGRDTVEENRDVVNSKVQKFISEFEKKYGTTGCTALTGCDLSTEDGLKKFNDLNMHPKCSDFVGEATKIVLKTL